MRERYGADPSGMAAPSGGRWNQQTVMRAMSRAEDIGLRTRLLKTVAGNFAS